MYEAIREILMNAHRRNLRGLRQQDWLYLASCVTLTKKVVQLPCCFTASQTLHVPDVFDRSML